MGLRIVQDNKSTLRIIYIGGIEHNGSTLLGLALGNHPQIECVGELSQLPRLGWAGNHLCACGLPIKNCEYWRDVREAWEKITNADIGALIKAESIFDRNLSFPRLLLERTMQSPAFIKYCNHTLALYKAVQQVSGKSVIVDTSKRVSRAMVLSMTDGIDLRLIHLVRDARGVAYSSAKPQRAIQRAWWKSAARWRYINGSFRVVRQVVGNENTILVRYEDFIGHPEKVLEKIGRFVDLDLSSIADVLSSGGTLTSGHIGIGNGFLQGKREIVLRRTIDWPKKMPQNEQSNVWRMTAGGMHHYGYQQEPDCHK